MGRYSTVSVDVQIDEILPDIDTSDLIAELKSRSKTNEAANEALRSLHRMTGLSAWDWEKLVEAVKDDDGHRAIDLLQPILIRPTKFATPEALSALARDPVNGRPVIQ